MKSEFLREYEEREFFKRINDNELHEGNLFFKHKYPTCSLELFLKKANSFEEFEKRERTPDERTGKGRENASHYFATLHQLPYWPLQSR